MREIFSRRELEEVLRKIDIVAQDQVSESRLADQDDDALTRQYCTGVGVGLEMAGKWLEDLLRKPL